MNVGTHWNALERLLTLEHAAYVGTYVRYIPGEQERLMQEQQQRLAVAGLMVSHQFRYVLQINKNTKEKKQGLTSSLSQEYCNQVMPGFDQNERYLLEQRER